MVLPWTGPCKGIWLATQTLLLNCTAYDPLYRSHQVMPKSTLHLPGSKVVCDPMVHDPSNCHNPQSEKCSTMQPMMVVICYAIWNWFLSRCHIAQDPPQMPTGFKLWRSFRISACAFILDSLISKWNSSRMRGVSFLSLKFRITWFRICLAHNYDHGSPSPKAKFCLARIISPFGQM